MSRVSTREAFKSITNVSTKFENYFDIYDKVFGEISTDTATVVEIGVQNGGSLEMWRNVLGPNARVIGIDLNPKIRVLEEQGFEVFIGDMGLEKAWDQLSELLGGPESVDLLIDDGGHTNVQQMKAVSRGLELVKPGGFLIIEDTHASFMPKFANPSRYSGWNFLSELMTDCQIRRQSRSQLRFPQISLQISRFMVSTGIVAIKKGTPAELEIGVASSGADDTLGIFDYRWEAMSESRVFRALTLISKMTRHLFPIQRVAIWFSSRREYRLQLRRSSAGR